MFQNISKMTLTSTWMLKYFKFSKGEGRQINQTLPQWGVQSLIICGKHQNRERKRFSSYQTILATLAC